MGNFRNGVFAIGVFSGILIFGVIYYIVNLLEKSLWDLLADPIFGVLIGASASFYAAFVVFRQQSKADLQQRLTTLQHKLELQRLAFRCFEREVTNFDLPTVIEGGKVTMPPILKEWELSYSTLSDEEIHTAIKFSKGSEKLDISKYVALSELVDRQYKSLFRIKQKCFRNSGFPEEEILFESCYSISQVDFEKLKGNLKQLVPYVETLKEDLKYVSSLNLEIMDRVTLNFQRDTGWFSDYKQRIDVDITPTNPDAAPE